jgi:glycosyltransferase involved in cell wall biosynthesis
MATTKPLITIVTPSFNQGSFILDAVESVLNQTYPNIEYIIMDGGSSDDTLEKLARYKTQLTLYSEADKGQADAINKGFRLANGAILGWLNADDMYLPDTLEIVAQYFAEHPSHSFVYGDGIVVNKNGKPFGRRANVRPTHHAQLLHEDDNILQPAAFWRQRLWVDVGELNTGLRFMLDYDYWLRVAQQFELFYIAKPLAYERLHAATKTASGHIERLQEMESVIQSHGGSGLPRAFHAEAQVTYFVSGIRNYLIKQPGVGAAYLRKAAGYWRWHPRHALRVLLYLSAFMVWRGRGTVIMRLYASRLGTNLK